MNRSDDLTVGEVLSLLQEDYPEATLGRLREFEDLSLITPELGTSGHRRYPAATLDRLRWVLAKMRDGFDPADLIDESGQPVTPEPEGDPRPSGSAAVVRKKSGAEQSAEPTLFEADQTRVQPLPKLAGDEQAAPETTPKVGEDTAAHRVVRAPVKPPAPSPRRQPEPPPPKAAEPKVAQPKPVPPKAAEPKAAQPEPPPTKATKPKAAEPKAKAKPAPEPASEPERAQAKAAQPAEPQRSPTAAEHRERRERVEAISALQEPPTSEAPPRPRPSRSRDLPSDTEATDLIARPDFLIEVGLDEETLGDMERFAVISPVTIGGTSSYDQSAVVVGKIVAELLELGYEARHLRMFRMAAEREVDLLRQMALPLLMQRNPVGREQARERLSKTAELGAKLNSALVAEGVAELIDHSGAEAAGPTNGR